MDQPIKTTLKVGTLLLILITFNLSAQNFIEITSPNAEDAWMTGTEKSIKWDYNIDGSETIIIDLYKDLVFVEELVMTSCSGNYTWDLPQDIEQGNDYKIMITSQNEPAINDESDLFEIYQLEVPVLTNPVDSYVANESSVTFEWSAARGATGYNFYISTYPDFTGATAQTSQQTSYTVENVPNGTYYWKVQSKYYSSQLSDFSEVRSLTVDTSSINEPKRPQTSFLHQNYPNPFNPETTISFDLHRSSTVTIRVFNSSGEIVRTLLNNYLDQGSYDLEFDGSELNSGVYYLVMETESYRNTIKTILIK